MTNTNSCISQKQSGIGRTNQSHRQFSMTYDCFNPVFIEWKATGLVSTFFPWFRWHDFPSQDCIVLSFWLQLRLCRKWKRALEVFDVKLFLRDFFRAPRKIWRMDILSRKDLCATNCEFLNWPFQPCFDQPRTRFTPFQRARKRILINSKQQIFQRRSVM